MTVCEYLCFVSGVSVGLLAGIIAGIVIEKVLNRR